MSLWLGYHKMLDSKEADLNNVSEGPYAGAITAALYLQEFVEPGIPWAHFDIMAWNPQGRPGRPEGPKPRRCAPSTRISPSGSAKFRGWRLLACPHEPSYSNRGLIKSHSSG